jgi:transposase-like protein
MMTLKELMATFPTNDACKDFLKNHRWPDGVVKCPRCGNAKVGKLNWKPFNWVCKLCGDTPYRFSVTVNTIFENTKYPLTVWFQVLWQMLNSKKGVSALQIQRQIGCGDYRTAWYMCHRLRAAMHDPSFQQLLGIVEVDEMYVGGKDKNRHWNKKSHKTGGEASGKTAVIGAISRKDNVVCQMIENTSRETLDGFISKVVSPNVSLLATDEYPAYGRLDRIYAHQIIQHREGIYVRGEVHTNNIESFWSLIKRGVMGSFHHVSRKYLPLYLAEFQFRFNNRKNPDIFGEAIAGC